MSYLENSFLPADSLPLTFAASRKFISAFVAALLLTLIFSPLAGAPAANAQGLAEEHTVLYYLLEIQRRQDKNCQGTAFPQAPSLTPSYILLNAAEEIASGTPLTEALSKRGLDYSQILVATTADGSAQDAFARLKQQYCPFIMKDSYLYVGAARNNGQWVLLMSPNEGSGMAYADPGQNGGYTPPDAGQTDTPPAPEPGVEHLTDPNPKPVMPDSPVAQVQPGASGAPDIQDQPAQPVPPAQPGAILKSDPLLNIRHKDAQDYSGTAAVPPAATPPPGTPPIAVPPAAVPAAPQPAYPAPATPSAVGPDSVPANEIIHEAAPSPVQKLPPIPAGQVDPARLEPFLPKRPIGLNDQEAMAAFIDQVRVRGYMCGDTFMQPVPGLAYNQTLAAEAQRHAEDMAAKNFFSSTAPGGKNLAARVSATGYQYHDLGELLGRAAPPVERILVSWLSNPRQCAMIMNPSFTEIGTGYETLMNNFVIIFAAPELTDSPAPK